jgi:hypothetical protein
MAKKYDLLVKTGEYEVNGQKKAKFENVGVVLEKDGKPFIMLKRTFNPAGVGDPAKDSILISMFEPRENNQANAASGNPVSAVAEDHIPF